VCRCYGRLHLGGLHDVDYRTKTFSCSVCGSDAYLCLAEPNKETSMEDYLLDECEKPRNFRGREAAHRTGTATSKGGELPGRKVDGRR
jgi:hypothetical protein